MKILIILISIALIHALQANGVISNFMFMDNNCTNNTYYDNCTNGTYEFDQFEGTYDYYLEVFTGFLNVWYCDKYCSSYSIPMVLEVDKTFSSAIGQYNWTMLVDFTDMNAGKYSGHELYLNGRGTFTHYGDKAVGKVSYMYTTPSMPFYYYNVSWYGGFTYNGTNLTEN